jgi:hypothetical protein
MLELLNEILSFYVPSAEQITQNCTFRGDSELQMIALKLCYFGMSDFVTLENLTDPEQLQMLKDAIASYDNTFLDILVEDIPGGEYLLTRSWFCRNTKHHQLGVLMLKIAKMDHLIDPCAPDFREHLNDLMDELLDSYTNYAEPELTPDELYDQQMAYEERWEKYKTLYKEQSPTEY